MTRYALAAVLAALWCAPALAQTVTQAIDERESMELAGNTRPEARLANDRGLLPDETPVAHMQLLLKRPPATEAALARFMDSQLDKASPDYHHWLTAAEFGRRFGPAESDIAAVTGWLGSHGFTVHGVAPGRTMVDFSGTAGQIRAAFRTEMHRLNVGGTPHIANMSDPRIPAALAGVVEGIVSLHDFRPHTNFKHRPAYTVNTGLGLEQLVVPGDLATIYNFKPLFSAGITGAGQTVVVIEDTDVFATADWTTFRAKFGLSSYTGGSFAQVHPTGAAACADPGVVAGNEIEAELDAEWASAAAPAAAIQLAACADSTTTFGGLLALENLVNSASPPAIVSISYGECETENGAAANAAFSAVYQQAAALGVSVYVAAGDEGAASCDYNVAQATHGIAVSGFATTAYNVAVGGTDFADAYFGTTATYWSNRNTSTYASAKSYIQETPWNNSCANPLIAASNGYSVVYGAAGFCNSLFGELLYLTTSGGSGGPSACATGVPKVAGIVSGTCRGRPKPSWQAVLGNPADKVRDIPDVSLFAANGAWGHAYVFCDSDTADGGAACTGAPSGWASAGGTSFASPILAGIQALVNQKAGGRQGNPAPVLYRLAAAEYGTTGSAACNSIAGNTVGASCIFYDVTFGNMEVDCTGGHNCYRPGGSYGVLSTSNKAFLPAYANTTGWDYATGIGTVNATNLVNNW